MEMLSWHRPGQAVECIVDLIAMYPKLPQFLSAWPQHKEVYHISDVVMQEGTLCFVLVELPTAVNLFKDIVLDPFCVDAEFFRPVKTTDISSLKKLCNPSPEAVREYENEVFDSV